MLLFMKYRCISFIVCIVLSIFIMNPAQFYPNIEIKKTIFLRLHAIYVSKIILLHFLGNQYYIDCLKS